MGASIYDVRSGWEGVPNSEQNQLICEIDNGGGGKKIRGCHIWKPPNGNSLLCSCRLSVVILLKAELKVK